MTVAPAIGAINKSSAFTAMSHRNTRSWRSVGRSSRGGSPDGLHASSTYIGVPHLDSVPRISRPEAIMLARADAPPPWVEHGRNGPSASLHLVPRAALPSPATFGRGTRPAARSQRDREQPTPLCENHGFCNKLWRNL